MIKALIFDVDGTIAETEELHRKAYNEIFIKEGIDWIWSKDLYKKLLKIAGGKERIKYYEETVAKKKYYLKNKDILRIHKNKNNLYTQWVDKGSLNTRPGIKSLINNALKNRVKLAIATSTSMINVKSLIQNCFGVKPQEIFECIATGEMVKKKKPNSELYNLALNQLSIDPKNCIALEDSNIGLLSAKGAHIYTICSPSEYHRDDNFIDADFICEDFKKEKLPNIMRQLIFI